MDQLKTFGRWMKTNSFWVLCGFISLLALGFWFWSTGALQAEADSRRSALESKDTTVSNIISKPNHPNPVIHQKMEERNLALVNDVYVVWMEQFEKQQPILTWPDRLGSQFISKVKELRPIEQKVKFPAEREILDFPERTRYRDFINLELPRLAKVIGAEWQATSSGGSGKSGAGGMGMAAPIAMNTMGPGVGAGIGQSGQSQKTGPQPLVDWLSTNQSSILQSRFDWSGRADKVPTTLEVLYAQEDYWILRAVMEIIRATNGDIEHRYQAAVKTIEAIDFGRDAIGMAGEVSSVDSTQQSGGMMMPQAAGMGQGASGAGSMADAMSKMGTQKGASTPGDVQIVQEDPGDNRYVNLKYEPLTAEQIRAAIESTNPEDAFLMVAKRIPVRIRMKIDQRKLPKLLAECCNASLELEVKQLRINCPPGSTASAGGMRSMKGMMGGVGAGAAGAGITAPPPVATDQPGGLAGGGGLGGAPGGMPGTGGIGMMGGGSGQALSDESPYDVTAELYGIIYIYNPVDMEKLGKKLDEAPAVDADSETPPATEAAPPTAAVPAAPAGEATASATSAG